MATILPLHLPDHLHTLLISTVCFAAIHHLAAPEFAQFLLGKKAWEALGPRERVGWCVLAIFSPTPTVGLSNRLLGNHAWHRSSTRCSSSRSPRVVSIFLPLRQIARLGGTHASARSLQSRAGKSARVGLRCITTRHLPSVIGQIFSVGFGRVSGALRRSGIYRAWCVDVACLPPG